MINIRSAKIEDAATLLAIYKPYVENTAITFEYDVPTVEEFAGRIQKTLEKYPYLVIERIADSDGANDANEATPEILGYCYAGVFKARAAYNHCVETSIYIKMGEHGKGYGRTLYSALESELKNRGIKNAYACIASPKIEGPRLDKSSQKFHEKLGYTLVGTFHDCGYKFNQWFNMIWMEKMLGEHP